MNQPQNYPIVSAQEAQQRLELITCQPRGYWNRMGPPGTLMLILVNFIEDPVNWDPCILRWSSLWELSAAAEDKAGGHWEIRLEYPAGMDPDLFERAVREAVRCLPFDDKENPLCEVFVKDKENHILIVKEKLPHAKRFIARMGEQSYLVRDARDLEYAVRRHHLDKEPYVDLRQIYPLPEIKEPSFLTIFVGDRDNREESSKYEYVMVPLRSLRDNIDSIEI